MDKICEQELHMWRKFYKVFPALARAAWEDCEFTTSLLAGQGYIS